MRPTHKEIQKNKEKQENRKAVMVVCGVTVLSVAYYYALKLLILPLFCTPQTIEWLVKARTFSHRASALMLLSSFLTIVTWCLFWIAWDCWKEKKGK